jgi:hypothetical protein
MVSPLLAINGMSQIRDSVFLTDLSLQRLLCTIFESCVGNVDTPRLSHPPSLVIHDIEHITR